MSAGLIPSCDLYKKKMIQVNMWLCSLEIYNITIEHLWLIQIKAIYDAEFNIKMT